MSNTRGLLQRLLRFVNRSSDYFVSGSLSFLPLLDNYRKPNRDVDAAIAQRLFEQRKHLLGPEERIHWLSLSEVAIASESVLSRVLSPRTGFVHVEGPDGLLDLSCYARGPHHYSFFLGAGITLELPSVIDEYSRLLSWEGISYRAGPAELAFIPKAVWYLTAKSGQTLAKHPDADTVEDLRRLKTIVDWELVRLLLAQGGVRWFGRRFPRFIRRKIDPFSIDGILELANGPLTT